VFKDQFTSSNPSSGGQAEIVGHISIAATEAKTSSQKQKKQTVSVGGCLAIHFQWQINLKMNLPLAIDCQSKIRKECCRQNAAQAGKDLKDAIGINESFYSSMNFRRQPAGLSEALNKPQYFRRFTIGRALYPCRAFHPL